MATAPDGHPALYASPVDALAPDIPLSPRLMGRLVPQSINLWLGATPHGGQQPALAPWALAAACLLAPDPFPGVCAFVRQGRGPPAC